MGARVDVRVDADGDRRALAARRCDLGQGLELGLGFDVEAADAFVEPERHFGARLADAGEDDLVGRDAGGARAAQLALGDDVHAGAQPRQRRQHRLIGIGLHRVADQRRPVGESRAEDAKMALDRRRWNSNRTACRPRRAMSRQIDVFGVQGAVAIGEMVHGAYRSGSSTNGVLGGVIGVALGRPS